jgi:hypothetical protein
MSRSSPPYTLQALPASTPVSPGFENSPSARMIWINFAVPAV